MTFEPKIVGFLCNWCSYTGADLAGTARVKYAPNVRVVRVMCSGRVDPTFILKAFAAGADGVLVAGCHPGDCHYINGNHKTFRRMPLLHRLLEDYGIDRRRFRLEWVSASEGERFGTVVNDFTKAVRELGPWRPATDGETVAQPGGGDSLAHAKPGSAEHALHPSDRISTAAASGGHHA